MPSPSKFLCAAILLMTGSQLALALPEDRLQPLKIKAENNIGNVNGNLTYSGSVVITQGSLKLEADKVETRGDQQTIDCTGTPASFQLNTEEYGLITGSAKNLYFDRGKGQLLLSKGAKLTKADGSSTQGNTITYDLTSETWTIEGDTTTVLPPAVQKKEDANGDS